MPGTESYSRTNENRQTERIEKARYEKLEAEVKDLREKAEKAEAEKRQAERYSKLSELRQEGYSLDPQKELARTAKFDDEAFEAHLDCITENYPRLPMGQPSLYTPDLETPAQKADQDKKARYSKRAVEIATAAANAGRRISSTEAFEQAVKEANGAA